MPQQKGKTRDLTFAAQKVDRAIHSLNGRHFTSEEIHKMTGVIKGTINEFLRLKTKKGFLERIMHGCYRKVQDGSLTQNLPMAFTATKVWEILRQSDKPLIHREISEIITEDTGFNTYSEIGVLLLIWCRRKVLDKIGGKKPYAYQIKPDYNLGRPSASKPF